MPPRSVAAAALALALALALVPSPASCATFASFLRPPEDAALHAAPESGVAPSPRAFVPFIPPRVGAAELGGSGTFASSSSMPVGPRDSFASFGAALRDARRAEGASAASSAVAGEGDPHGSSALGAAPEVGSRRRVRARAVAAVRHAELNDERPRGRPEETRVAEIREAAEAENREHEITAAELAAEGFLSPSLVDAPGDLVTTEDVIPEVTAAVFWEADDGGADGTHKDDDKPAGAEPAHAEAADLSWRLPVHVHTPTDVAPATASAVTAAAAAAGVPDIPPTEPARDSPPAAAAVEPSHATPTGHEPTGPDPGTSHPTAAAHPTRKERRVAQRVKDRERMLPEAALTSPPAAAAEMPPAGHSTPGASQKTAAARARKELRVAQRVKDRERVREAEEEAEATAAAAAKAAAAAEIAAKRVKVAKRVQSQHRATAETVAAAAPRGGGKGGNDPAVRERASGGPRRAGTAAVVFDPLGQDGQPFPSLGASAVHLADPADQTTVGPAFLAGGAGVAAAALVGAAVVAGTVRRWVGGAGVAGRRAEKTALLGPASDERC